MDARATERARQLETVIHVKERHRDELIVQAQDHLARALDLKRKAQEWQSQIDRNRRELAELSKTDN